MYLGLVDFLQYFIISSRSMVRRPVPPKFMCFKLELQGGSIEIGTHIRWGLLEDDQVTRAPPSQETDVVLIGHGYFYSGLI
jgi:hypothetical protein